MNRLSKEDQELVDLSTQSVAQSLHAIDKKVDVRPTKIFGNLFTKEAYTAAHTRFPALNDDRDVVHKKISNLFKQYSQDLVFFKYGHMILSAFAGVGAFYICNHFRRYFRLLHYGRYGMFGTAVAFPSFFAGAINYSKSATVIPFQGDKGCPPCIAVKNALYHSALAIAYPLVICGIQAPYYARTYVTVDLKIDFMPDKRGDTWRTVWKAMRDAFHKGRFPSVIYGMILVNIGAAYWISFRQQTEYVELYGKILQEEQAKIDGINPP